ncbi:MAG: copper chaperone PCu(A)C [Limnohabitans sp.]
MLRSYLIPWAALWAVLVSTNVQAQIIIKDAWVRATVAQQKATGAFMQLQSAQDAKLVAAQSPVAGVVEVHEMAMDGGVMKMRAVPSLALPAGKAVELKPGGYHIMLMDLKAQVKDGDTVPVTLVVEGQDGKRQTHELQAVARRLAASGVKQGHGQGGHRH